MANTHTTLSALFKNIANAIRTKTGKTENIKADDFPTAISEITTGITPTGTKTITTNGTHDVANYANAEVNVPSTGITPSGTKSITTNGTHDVTNYANAEVNVPIGITPTGTKTITSNGTHDVTNYASALVNVATGITPTGTLNITSNGTHDVTNYASADVDITALNARLFTVNVSADKTSGTLTLVAADSFLASLYNDPDAFIFMRCKASTASTAMLSFWFSSYFPIGYAGATAKYDIVARCTTSAMNIPNGSGLSGTNNSGHLILDSSGNLKTKCNSTYPLRAGEYQIIAGKCAML